MLPNSRRLARMLGQRLCASISIVTSKLRVVCNREKQREKILVAATVPRTAARSFNLSTHQACRQGAQHALRGVQCHACRRITTAAGAHLHTLDQLSNMLPLELLHLKKQRRRLMWEETQLHQSLFSQSNNHTFHLESHTVRELGLALSHCATAVMAAVACNALFAGSAQRPDAAAAAAKEVLGAPTA